MAYYKQFALSIVRRTEFNSIRLWDFIVPVLGRSFVILNEVKASHFAPLITQRRWCDANSNCEIPRRRGDSG
jgi:hypothetical protein